MWKEFAAKEKLEIIQSEKVASVGGRKGGLGGIPPAPRQFLANSVRIFSNAHRQFSEFGFWANVQIKKNDIINLLFYNH